MPMTFHKCRRRALKAALLGAGVLTALLAGTPVLALEEVLIEIPLLETTVRVSLNELGGAEKLQQGSSDLAELDRATDGAVGRQVRSLLLQPVPLSLRQVADGSVGSPLLEQAMLVISSLGTVEGRSTDLSGRTLRDALLRASAQGEPTLLSLMQAIPGQRVTLNLGRARAIVSRMARQRQQAEALLASTTAATAAPAAPQAPVAAASSRDD
jgi:hypothetical protein